MDNPVINIIANFVIHASTATAIIFPWWLSSSIYILFGFYLSWLLIYQAARICPNPKTGSYIFIGIFTLGEIAIIYNQSNTHEMKLMEYILRFPLDIGILGALILASRYSIRKKNYYS